MRVIDSSAGSTVMYLEASGDFGPTHQTMLSKVWEIAKALLGL